MLDNFTSSKDYSIEASGFSYDDEYYEDFSDYEKENDFEDISDDSLNKFDDEMFDEEADDFDNEDVSDFNEDPYSEDSFDDEDFDDINYADELEI